MLRWKLKRDIAVFDIESTGDNPYSDRIIEIAVIRLAPTGERRVHKWRINPGIPIPAEAMAIHGISDADVAGCPAFRALAAEIGAVFENCDLAGFNLLGFDIPIIVEEFKRAEVAFDLKGRRIIDAQRIYHKREPRNLSAALAFYRGEMHLDAHGAEGDALATLRVLEGQFDKYPDLPADIDVLHEYCNIRKTDWVDAIGKLKWMNNEVAVNFGQKRGATLRSVAQNDPGFLKWMLKGDFPSDTKEIVRKALEGEFPAKSRGNIPDVPPAPPR